MPLDDTKMLQFKQYQKCYKASFIFYADFKCIREKIDECKNNPQSSSTTKVSEHIPSGISISAISFFGNIENKHDVYRGKDCMNP